jgi:type II pantothenate kinase
MLPFARELLRRGTEVLLAANSVPSINDITAEELSGVLHEAAARDRVLGRALDEGCLAMVPSGSDMPVIDLNKAFDETLIFISSSQQA